MGSYMKPDAGSYEVDYPIRDSTKRSYAKAVAAALRHSREKRRISYDERVDLTLTNIAQDLIDREDISQNSKLASRAALLRWMKIQPESTQPDGIRAEGILRNMDRQRGRPATNRPTNIKESEISLLLAEVHRRATKNKSEWAARCEAWIVAGLACGARPVEWLNTEWVTPEKTLLRIKNAKKHLGKPAFLRGMIADEDHNIFNDVSFSNTSREREYPEDVDFYDESFRGDDHTENITHPDDTANEGQHSEDGIYRIVPIETDAYRHAISRHLALIEELIPKNLDPEDREYLFRKYHRESSRIMSRCSERVWSGKKNFSFYSLRKQFSANMKAAFGSTVTAGLMGHSGPDSPSAVSYGKASQAHKDFKAKGVMTAKWRPASALKRSDKNGPATDRRL